MAIRSNPTFAVGLLFSIALSGCSPGGGSGSSSPPAVSAPAPRASATPTSNAPLPAIDATTPDRALKSYWAVKDWIRTTQDKKVELTRDESTKKAERDALARVATGNVFANLSSREYLHATYDREIDGVKVETDSRAVAVVTIKNVTAIPDGAEADARVRTIRESGERYKYVLEKSASGWAVSEVWQWDTFTRKWSKNWLSSAKGSMYPYMTYGGI